MTTQTSLGECAPTWLLLLGLNVKKIRIPPTWYRPPSRRCVPRKLDVGTLIILFFFFFFFFISRIKNVLLNEVNV